jgi:hypothetical protein
MDKAIIFNDQMTREQKRLKARDQEYAESPLVSMLTEFVEKMHRMNKK